MVAECCLKPDTHGVQSWSLLRTLLPANETPLLDEDVAVVKVRHDRAGTKARLPNPPFFLRCYACGHKWMNNRVGDTGNHLPT